MSENKIMKEFRVNFIVQMSHLRSVTVLASSREEAEFQVTNDEYHLDDMEEGEMFFDGTQVLSVVQI